MSKHISEEFISQGLEGIKENFWSFQLWRLWRVWAHQMWWLGRDLISKANVYYSESWKGGVFCGYIWSHYYYPTGFDLSFEKKLKGSKCSLLIYLFTQSFSINKRKKTRFRVCHVSSLSKSRLCKDQHVEVLLATVFTTFVY